jgi:hypothetical protein
VQPQEVGVGILLVEEQEQVELLCQLLQQHAVTLMHRPNSSSIALEMSHRLIVETLSTVVSLFKLALNRLRGPYLVLDYWLQLP